MRLKNLLLVASVAWASASLGEPVAVDMPSPQLGLDGRPAERFLQMHKSFLEKTKLESFDLVFMGDSITEGWNYVPEVWNGAFGQYKPVNFGIAGIQTQHALWLIAHGVLDKVRPKVVVLLIGTNNYDRQPDMIARGVTKVVTEIRAHLPRAKVLLLGIFPRGADFKQNFKLRLKIRRTNDILAKLDDNKWIRFLDIGADFLDMSAGIPADLFPDGLHPAEPGYRIWAEKMSPLLNTMME